MIRRRAMALISAIGMLAGGCTAPVQSSATPGAPTASTSRSGSTSTVPASTVPASTTTSTLPASTTTSTASTTTSTASTTTSTTSTTTSTVPALDVYDPACVVAVRDGDSLLGIVERFDDDTVDVDTVMAENALGSDAIAPPQLLDVCVDNGLDDITGETRPERNAAVVRREVTAQQTKLNELFAGLGIRELLVDGISGPVTRQRLCAFRLASGLPVSTEDMAAGSDEERLLMATPVLPIPFTSALAAERWILIDRTCQIMFVGAGVDHLAFVFPTSTGEPGHATRDQKLSRVFKYNPAAGNGGWHNSTTYPAADDNPLNGNMYKPLYFDRGQAIHGANNVPTSPQSKGCARLRVEHQQLLVDWLGLGDAGSIVTDRDRINVTVTVQGTYVPR